MRMCLVKNDDPNIQQICGISSRKMVSTILYEDNDACMAQLERGYIKGDRTKHISLKLFFARDLQKNDDIDVQQIRSCENLVDLFTKVLSISTIEKLVNGIGMRRLRDIM